MTVRDGARSIVLGHARLMLARPAAARAAVGHAPLVLNATLAADAQAKAQALAAADRGMVHDDWEARRHEGENLFQGYVVNHDDWATATTWFVDERRFYPAGGVITADGAWDPWGHWSQVVWPETASVGMGQATAASGTIYMAMRYWPAGNVMGRGPLP